MVWYGNLLRPGGRFGKGFSCTLSLFLQLPDVHPVQADIGNSHAIAFAVEGNIGRAGRRFDKLPAVSAAFDKVKARIVLAGR